MNSSTKARRRIFTLAAIISTGALTFGSYSAAFAEETPVAALDQAEEQQLRDLLTKFDVPAKAQETLVDKAGEGVVWGM